VPSANTDGTRPANISHVEVFRFTGPSAVSDEQLIESGTRVARLRVKAPRNPDLATKPGEPVEEPDLKEEGVDQGSIAELEDHLDGAAWPAELSGRARAPARGGAALPQALVGPPASVPSATYVAAAFSTRGRRGPLSRRVVVPLAPPPPPPSSLEIGYDETRIRVSWRPPPSFVPPEQTDGLLPRRLIGLALPALGFHVYDVSSGQGDDQTRGASALPGPQRLTDRPLAQPGYEDRRLEWGATRCFSVRTVATVGTLALESDPAPPACATLEDTFPPRPPRDLKAVAAERAISLIWEPNSEPDLVGYLVLRGTAGGEALDRLTPAPIRETSFSDVVPSGVSYTYAVQAIDRAGNLSPLSNRVEDTAR
jgi:hypothetical protein